MPISWQNKTRNPILRGFTLIEMMAVLVLLALLSAVVLPNFERLFNNTEERAKAAELATILQKLYARSALMGINVDIDNSTLNQTLPDGKPAIELPTGWRLAENQVLRVRAFGSCERGIIKFESSKKTTISLFINSENCEISVQATDRAPS